MLLLSVISFLNSEYFYIDDSCKKIELFFYFEINFFTQKEKCL